MNQGKKKFFRCPAVKRLAGSCLLVWLCCAVCFIWSESTASAQNWLLNTHARVTGAVIPIFPESGSVPLAIARTGKIHCAHQKKGFFRIGVLPLLVLEDLSLELRDKNQISAALVRAGIHFSAGNMAKNAVEVRGFNLSFTDQPNGSVHAQTVRLENATTWMLHDGRVELPNAATIPFTRAILTIAGPNAGELAYETVNGPATLQLLALIPEKNPNSPKS